MTRKKPITMAELEELGFDKCRQVEVGERITIGCSQCAAVAINGVPCHETGCPNMRHECAECGDYIEKKYRLCESCANPDPPDPVQCEGCQGEQELCGKCKSWPTGCDCDEPEFKDCDECSGNGWV